MSDGSRLAIGIVAIIGAIGFLKTALNPVGVAAPSIVFQILAALFAFIAIACFCPKSHPITLRIIGAAIFLSYSRYVLISFNTDNFERSLDGFRVWALPSGYLAIFGKYPDRSLVSAVFAPKKNRNK
jgi:hypothetical protein